MPHKNGKKYYSASERALIEQEKEEEAMSTRSAQPVIRDLGIDRHINYEEIEASAAKSKSVLADLQKQEADRKKKKKGIFGY